jgi:hypothetical protein
MANKKRANALASLAEEMYVQTAVRNDAPQTEASISKKEQVRQMPRSRVVSNIPWYPKSEKLKKELKLLALHEDSSVTALIDEGIRMVLEKRGKNMDDYL